MEAKKKITTDFLYTVGATVILNAVLQIVVYPLINRISGQEALGNVTYYMSFVSIAVTAVGTATCNNRLALNNKFDTKSGDYLLYLALMIPVAAVISCIILSVSFGVADYILYCLLLALYCIRAYGSVQYRIVLSYKKYFFLFLITSVGYLIGIGIYYFINYWQIVFIAGELLGCIYTFFTGKVLRFDGKSKNLTRVFKSTFILSCSLLIFEITSNVDKIVLKNFDSADAVSLYYTISSVPKILFLLSQPINSIVLSYTASKKLELNRKNFIKLLFLYIAISAAFYLFSVIGIPVFMKILYADLWAQAKQYMFLVPVIVIIDLLCSMLSNLIFAEFGSKYHLIIYSTFLLYYLPLTILGTKTGGISGFINFAVIAEVVKLIFIIVFGIYKFSKNEKYIALKEKRENET